MFFLRVGGLGWSGWPGTIVLVWPTLALIDEKPDLLSIDDNCDFVKCYYYKTESNDW